MSDGHADSAGLDPHEHGFHLNPHFVITPQTDGSVVVTAPWTTCVAEGADEQEAVARFNEKLRALLAESEDEREALATFAAAHGYTPYERGA